MNHSTLRKSGLVAGVAAAAALAAIGVPLAAGNSGAAPNSAPPSDTQGYVDSTARCAKADTAVIFGTTGSSRVAICQTAGGDYQYRGVRVNDGAKLVVTATRTSGGSFVAKNDGVTYTVTPQALSVAVGGNTVRTEAWTDYHGPQSPASTSGTPKSPTTSTSLPTTSGAATPSTSGVPSAPSTPGLSSVPGTSAAAAPKTSSAPLPPPLPAEVGGSTSAIR